MMITESLLNRSTASTIVLCSLLSLAIGCGGSDQTQVMEIDPSAVEDPAVYGEKMVEAEAERAKQRQSSGSR
jgi:hypothetical protein